MDNRPTINPKEPSQVSVSAVETHQLVTSGSGTNNTEVVPRLLGFSGIKWAEIFRIVLIVTIILVPIIVFLFWFIGKNKKLVQQYDHLSIENKRLKQIVNQYQSQLQDATSSSCCLTNATTTKKTNKKTKFDRNDQYEVYQGQGQGQGQGNQNQPQNISMMMPGIDIVIDPEGKVYTTGIMVQDMGNFENDDTPNAGRIEELPDDQDDFNDDQQYFNENQQEDAEMVEIEDQKNEDVVSDQQTQQTQQIEKEKSKETPIKTKPVTRKSALKKN